MIDRSLAVRVHRAGGTAALTATQGTLTANTVIANAQLLADQSEL